MPTRFFDPPTPRLFGHRGFPARYPENTMASFRAAVEAGVEYLEFDVWATRDGEIVVHHDASLARMCAVERRVPDLALEELRSLPICRTSSGKQLPRDDNTPAEYVPTLRQVLEELSETFMTIEIKPTDFPVERFLREHILDSEAQERVLLASSQDVVLQKIRSTTEEIPTSFAYGEIRSFFQWLDGGRKAPYHPPGQALQIPPRKGLRRLVTKKSVQAVHDLGLEMHVWTVNRAGQMRGLLDLGVDGIMSDNPQLLKTVAADHSGAV